MWREIQNPQIFQPNPESFSRAIIFSRNRVINSLVWSGRGEFNKSKRKNFWVYNERSGRGELAGYVNEGGGLTYAIIRNAGHMVPISQPLWAWDLATQFTHLPATPSSMRFQRPEQIKAGPGTKFYNCEWMNEWMNEWYNSCISYLLTPKCHKITRLPKN
jgi:hypothetical protein